MVNIDGYMYLENFFAKTEYEIACYVRCKLMLPADFQAPHNANIFVIINLISELSWILILHIVKGQIFKYVFDLRNIMYMYVEFIFIICFILHQITAKSQS